MNKLITKYSIVYWIVITALLVGAFVGTNGFQWYQWLFIAIAVAMAAYYFIADIQG